jgi:glycosyltransferase involved in cell wall biosynthesis
MSPVRESFHFAILSLAGCCNSSGVILAKAENPISVSMVEPVGGHGGMGPYDSNLCRGLAGAGIDVALFTSDLSGFPATSTFSVRPVFRGVFGQDPPWRRGLRFLRGMGLMLLTSIKENRKICHLHFFVVGPLQLANVALARLFFRKVVITAHDVESFFTGLDTPGFPRLAYGLAHSVVAHNRVSKEELIRTMGLPQEKIRVIPAGNHLGSLPPLPTTLEARTRLDLPSRGPILLFFGQIKQVKGLDVLLEAMPAILAEHPDATLVIAGRPMRMDFQEYQDCIDRLGLGSHVVTHIRYIPDQDLPFYYQACDLVTLPYRRIYQSDVLLMAMSYGKAVVTSDIPGMTEMIEDGRTGFIFRSGDAADCARTVNLALGDPSLRQGVAQGGRQLMAQNYTWETIGSAMADLYRTL